MASYYRISPKFWSDEKVIRWSEDARLLALYLLTSPHRSLEGLFRIPKAYILADLRWNGRRLSLPFSTLDSDGFIAYDVNAEVLLLCKALAYQAPANANMVTKAVNDLQRLPATPLLDEFYLLAKRFSQPLAERMAQWLPERFRNGLPNKVEPARPTQPQPLAFTAAAAAEADDNGCPNESPSPPTDVDAAAAKMRRSQADGIALAYAGQLRTQGVTSVVADVTRLAGFALQLLSEGHDVVRVEQAAVQVAIDHKQPGSLPYVLSDLLKAVASNGSTKP